MADFLLRMTLPYKTGLPRDVTQTSFAMQAATLPGDPADVEQAVDNFWNLGRTGGSFAIASFLSPIVDRTDQACTADIFEISHPSEHIGDPVFSFPFTITVAAGDAGGLPNEVAMCTSFKGSGATTQARSRGRMFIGPFNQNAVGPDSGGQAPPADELVTALVLATIGLRDDLETAGGTFSVWSRADHALYPVETGWVDNAWDTQRRRGLDPSQRTSW